MSEPWPLDFSMELDDRDGTAAIVVGGDLDVVAAEDLAAALRRQLESGRPLIVDLADVVFMDSSGLAAILKTPTADQRALITLCPSRHPQPRQLLQVTGALELFRTS